MSAHFAEEVYYDPIGQCIRLNCHCGYTTGNSDSYEDAGRDLDCHIHNEGLPKEATHE